MAQPDPHTATGRIHIRPATKADAPAITEVYFRSFTSPFFRYFNPDTPSMRAWFTQCWIKGLDNPTDRTFVAVDAEADKIVGFSRWQVPQPEGYVEHDSYPEIDPGDGEWDMQVVEPFFSGMDGNREKLMGKKPHWYLDMLGVHEEYQRQGIAGSFIRWGTQQADRDGVDMILHGSEEAQPYYIKQYGFEELMDIPIPGHPAYGSYKYKTLVRKPQILS